MVFRSSTSAIVVAVSATVMMVGAVQAADDAKYPDWKGAWTRWFPPGSVREPNGGFTAGGLPRFLEQFLARLRDLGDRIASDFLLPPAEA